MNGYKFFRKSVFISLLFFLSLTVIAQEQQNEGNTPVVELILDPELRFGRLDNGLRYYIRHNETQKGQADFYLAHKVGSMQEEDHQRGYAHFLEHLALRSSKNFPSKSGIKGYTEKAGLKTELFTGFDETIYKLMNVPVNNQSNIDSCLLILHDWTSFLLLEDDAIEEEREAARVEWRAGHTSQIRLWEQQLHVMYPKSKYGLRIPTGILGIIENFPKSDFLSFYKKWYSPDLQAVVIVGDIDVDKIEEKVKTIFSEIPKSSNTEPKDLYIVTDNDYPLISIVKEREETNATLTIYYKHDKLPLNLKGTTVDFMTNYLDEVIYQVMNERLAGLTIRPDAPFITASARDKNYFVSKTKSAWTISCIVKPDQWENAVSALIAETERLRQAGITNEEYERAKTQILKAYESAYNDREKSTNNYLASKYVNHFVNNDYMTGIEFEYDLIQQFAPVFEAEAINSYLSTIFKGLNYCKNMVISLTGPNNTAIKYPSEDELIDIYINACDEIVGGYDKELIDMELIPQLPTPGTIVSEREDTLFGTTVYTLNNGVTVVLKQTGFKQNQILMSARSPGGTTVFKDEKDSSNLSMINEAIAVSGLGELNAANLKKYLDYYKISYRSNLSESSEFISGEAVPSNLKTLFEIIYLQFTGIRSDTAVFSSYRESFKAQLENQRSNPDLFRDTFFSMAYGANSRQSFDFDKIDYNRMIDMYKERFADASDFVFTFVGDVDKQAIRPLLEQYIATLPSLNRKDKADESQVIPYQKGEIVKHFTIKATEPVSRLALLYSGNMPYNLKNLIVVQSLNNIIEIIFEEKLLPFGYTISNLYFSVDLFDFPEGRTSVQIFIDSNSETQKEILEVVKAELQKLAEEGPNDVAMIRNYNAILKKRKELFQANDYWLNIITSYYSNNFDAHTDYETILESLTKDDIKSFIKELLNQGNVIEVVMSPE